jgi:hypothetical protein
LRLRYEFIEESWIPAESLCWGQTIWWREGFGLRALIVIIQILMTAIIEGYAIDYTI